MTTSPRPTSARMGAVRAGSVAEFDDPRGLGTVAGDDGRRYPFHCTAVADGSRHIEVGTRVLFTTAPGHLGRIEARQIVPSELPSDNAVPA